MSLSPQTVKQLKVRFFPSSRLTEESQLSLLSILYYYIYIFFYYI